MKLRFIKNNRDNSSSERGYQSQLLATITKTIRDNLNSQSKKDKSRKDKNDLGSKVSSLLKHNTRSLPKAIKPIKPLKSFKSFTKYEPIKKEWDPNHTTLAWKG